MVIATCSNGTEAMTYAVQLLGFPLQLVGILALPWAYVKYVDESNSIVDDLGSAAVRCCLSASPRAIAAAPHCDVVLIRYLLMRSSFLS